MEDTKVLNCPQEEGAQLRWKMQHVLGRSNHIITNHHSTISTQDTSSTQEECSSRRGSVPSLLNQSLFHYLLSQRRYSSSNQIESHTVHQQDDIESENRCTYGERMSKPTTTTTLPYPRSVISGLSFWIPTVGASSISSSSPSSTVPTSRETHSKDTCQPAGNASGHSSRSPSHSCSTTTATGASCRSSTSSVAATSAACNTTVAGSSASAHSLSPDSVMFTSALALSSSIARVNLMSNSATALQNSFQLSLSRIATLAHPFTPPVATIKVLNSTHTSSGSSITGGQLEEKRHHLEKNPKTEATAALGQQPSARPRPAAPADDYTSARYPHRHSQIYDSINQQIAVPPSSTSTFPHQQQQSRTQQPFTFHPQVIASASNPPQHLSTDGSHFDSSLIHHQFHHLTLAEKERFERLFREIDINGNGYIDFNDLVHTLEAKGIKATHDNVKDVIERSDTNLDGDIDFAEFVNYCLENERKLHILFKDIDINDDGVIDESELVAAFERAGVEVDQQEVLKLVTRIKEKNNIKDGEAVELDFNEFRDYLLLHPTDSLHDLMKSWRHGTFVDLGEDGLMPVDFSENEIKSGMWWRHLIAGGVAGAVSRTATAPLDRLKVFLQVRGAEFNGLGVCLRHMIAEGGVISLWRGNGINVLKIAPETAIKFMAFDQMKRWIHSNKGGEITTIERFLAGSAAGAISQTVIYPMEVLKTRFCLRSTGQYSGLLDAARKINAYGGLRNFYRGYVPNLIGIIPYAGIDLTIYETLKKTYLMHNSMEEAPIYVCLACGTISSTFGQIASYPLALVRTRMQSESGFHRSSMLGMFKSILAKEGPKGLYRGITANIMKVAPAVSISYVVYEYTRRPLGAIMS